MSTGESMHRLRFFAIAAGAAAIAACATDRPPTLPGMVNAPPPPIAAAGDALLTGTVWRWTETVTSNGTRIKPDAPERYTLEFQPGGKIAVRADCNRGSGSYTLNGAALTFGPIATTRAMCPPGSKDAEFLRGLAAVSGQLFRGNDLVLTLKLDSGSMIFATSRQ
jgi:heat shock protein HslJ